MPAPGLALRVPSQRCFQREQGWQERLLSLRGPGLGLGAGEVGEGSFLGLHRACDPQSWGQAEREHRTSEVPSSGTVKLQRTRNFKCWICTCTRGYWILAGEA